MITFVALLMFLQLGVGWESSTVLCGLLTLPWVLKSFLRHKVRQAGRFAHVLRLVEAFIFGSLVALAFTFTASIGYRVGVIFGVLMLLCMFCAWHELAARMYYERMFRPQEQRYYNTRKMFFSQASTIVTYGVLMMVVGALEVFYHNRRAAITLSWSTAIYLLAGVYLLLFLYNFFALRSPRVGDSHQTESLRAAVRAEVDVIDRICHKRYWFLVVLCLFFVLLPQALMFYTRVIFLIASRAEGGLACSLQWIGLAQGTVGVMAFSMGLGLGHHLLYNYRRKVSDGQRSALKMIGREELARLQHVRVSSPWTYFLMVVALVLSPVVYLVMTVCPPTTLPPLCAATFIAQFCFGFGLNACMLFVRYISGERYRSTINYLYIPLVSFVMLPAIVGSGWLVSCLGFHLFFVLDVLLAFPALVAAYAGYRVVLNDTESPLLPSSSKPHIPYEK